MNLAEAPLVALGAPWKAELRLRYERVGNRTVLAERAHRGPLVVQKPLYPEGDTVCQSIIVHPPAGMAGGDVLSIDVEAGASAWVQLTTPGAAKWYRSAGPTARQDVALRAGKGAVVEWFPQGTIVFDGALAEAETRIDLAGDAVFIGWDIACLGRAAAGERFAHGSWRQRITLVRDGTLLFAERCNLSGGAALLASPVGLNGAAVFGTFLVAAGFVPDGALARCREAATTEGECAVTRVRDCIAARYRGPSMEAAQAYFAELWRLLRPAFAGREAVPARLWNT
jgi:urease accessory protein